MIVRILSVWIDIVSHDDKPTIIDIDNVAIHIYARIKIGNFLIIRHFHIRNYVEICAID